MLRLLAILLLAFPIYAKPPKKPLTASNDVVWTKLACVKDSRGCLANNYTVPIIMGGQQIRVYSNNNQSLGIAGNLNLQVGSWTQVGSEILALDVTNPRDTYIRTLGMARGASGAYYAVLYTGDGYPTQGGYSPSWATSHDGLVWSWAGPIGILGRNQSSAMNLIVNEARTDDMACMAWLDLAGGLILMHAPMPCEPSDWRSDGLSVWPIQGEQPQFVTAAWTPYGYHLIGADMWDGTTNRELRHLFSCTGLPPWHVVEMASDIGAGTSKGANLAYDPATNLIHALVSGNHFTLQAKNFGC